MVGHFGVGEEFLDHASRSIPLMKAVVSIRSLRTFWRSPAKPSSSRRPWLAPRASRAHVEHVEEAGDVVAGGDVRASVAVCRAGSSSWSWRSPLVVRGRLAGSGGTRPRCTHKGMTARRHQGGLPRFRREWAMSGQLSAHIATSRERASESAAPARGRSAWLRSRPATRRRARASLDIDDVVRLPALAAPCELRERVRADIDVGAPTNVDGTINLVHSRACGRAAGRGGGDHPWQLTRRLPRGRTLPPAQLDAAGRRPRRATSGPSAPDACGTPDRSGRRSEPRRPASLRRLAVRPAARTRPGQR